MDESSRGGIQATRTQRNKSTCTAATCKNNSLPGRIVSPPESFFPRFYLERLTPNQGFAKASLIGAMGAASGILAYWRRSVRPGMIAHVLQDVLGGILRH